MQLEEKQIEEILNLRIYHDSDATLLHAFCGISINHVVDVLLNSNLGDLIQDAMNEKIDVTEMTDKQKSDIATQIVKYIFHAQRLSQE